MVLASAIAFILKSETYMLIDQIIHFKKLLYGVVCIHLVQLDVTLKFSIIIYLQMLISRSATD